MTGDQWQNLPIRAYQTSLAASSSPAAQPGRASTSLCQPVPSCIIKSCTCQQRWNQLSPGSPADAAFGQLPSNQRLLALASSELSS